MIEKRLCDFMIHQLGPYTAGLSNHITVNRGPLLNGTVLNRPWCEKSAIVPEVSSSAHSQYILPSHHSTVFFKNFESLSCHMFPNKSPLLSLYIGTFFSPFLVCVKQSGVFKLKR